jgi:hypothetical protein
VGDLDFTIRDPAAHATGYLAKYSFMNLAKGFITDRGYWDGYDGRWLRLKNLELDGPSFGGLVGTAGGFGSFLGDQLRPGSALLGEESRRLLHTPQALDNGHPIPMTLGWHIGRPPAPITCSRRAAAAGSTARCGSTRRVASGRS